MHHPSLKQKWYNQDFLASSYINSELHRGLPGFGGKRMNEGNATERLSVEES